MNMVLVAARDRRIPGATTRMTAVGAAAGCAWGTAARAWMRFISTDPEFTWAGTLFIVGAASFVGAVLGMARARRRQGGAGWWRLSLMSLLLLGAGGAVMWPTVVAWAIALGRRRPWWLVTPLVLGGALVQIDVIRGTALDDWQRSAIAAAIAVLGYLVVLAVEAWGFSVAFARSVPGAGLARWKQAVVAVPIAAVAGLSLVVVGVGG